MALFNKKVNWFLLISVMSSSIVMANNASPKPSLQFQSQITPIPSAIQKEMKLYTWHANCPVPLSDLSYLRLTYWGYDNKPHQGELIVNKALAKEVTLIFKKLYQEKFPIQQMKLMTVFHGNDDASLAANNTAAFNCRPVTGQKIFSQHSYGRAIDINPLINPYVKGHTILPPTGAQFVDRSQPYPGKITHSSLIYKEFTKKSWDWGGNWHDLQDYQHFEKRAHGEKRNPNGYQ